MRFLLRPVGNSSLVLPIVCVFLMMLSSCSVSRVLTARMNPVELDSHVVATSIPAIALQNMELAGNTTLWTGPTLQASGTDVSMEELELSVEQVDPE